jgi:hypothetical protein
LVRAHSVLLGAPIRLDVPFTRPQIKTDSRLVSRRSKPQYLLQNEWATGDLSNNVDRVFDFALLDDPAATYMKIILWEAVSIIDFATQNMRLSKRNFSKVGGFDFDLRSKTSEIRSSAAPLSITEKVYNGGQATPSYKNECLLSRNHKKTPTIQR